MYTDGDRTMKAVREHSSRSVLTTAQSPAPRANSTERIDLEEIRLPKGKLAVHGQNGDGSASTTLPQLLRDSASEEPTFVFERRRLMEMGPVQLERYKLEGPVTDVDKEDPRAVRIALYNKLQLEGEESAIRRWSLDLKVLCIILTFWAVVSVIFSMIFTFVMSFTEQVNIVGNTLPMITNIIIAVWLINLSFKGNTVSVVDDARSVIFPQFTRLCAVTLAVLFIQIIVMPCVISLSEIFESMKHLSESSDSGKRSTALMYLGYMVVWFSAIINAASCGMLIGFSLLERRGLHLRDLRELERKTLPLGYQIYAKLTPGEQRASVPYVV